MALRDETTDDTRTGSGVRSPVATVAGALRLTDGAAHLDASWRSWSGPQGGLLAGLLLRAGGAVAGGRSPRALTVQFLHPVPEGAVHVDAQVVRDGGTSSTVAAALTAGGGPLVTATLLSGRARGGGAPWAGVPAPAVPRPEDCAPLELPVEMVPFSQHVHYRPADGRLPLAGGSEPVLTAWVRMRSQEPVDAAVLTVLSDAMPPALYGLTRVPVAVPSVELSVLYASGLDEEPQTGWVLVRATTRTAADGWCVDDADLWSESGRLLVQARQTRRVLGELVL